MKRFLVSLIIFCSLTAGSFIAQASPEQDEQIKRLSSDIDTLMASNAELQKKISALTDELSKVRDEKPAKSSTDDAALQSIREDIKKLADKIQEVDKKRVDDKGVIANQLEKIEKLVSAPPLLEKPKIKDKPAPAATNNNVSEKGYEYVVKSGDYFSKILKNVNAQFKSDGKKTITLKQLTDANPNLKPEKLNIGDKVFIPEP